jgi:hypothetical protein
MIHSSVSTFCIKRIDFWLTPSSIRCWIGFASIVLLLGSAKSSLAQTEQKQHDTSTLKNMETELVWEAKVNIGDMISVGASKRGVRRIIPITGGTFAGPNIQGKVIPGGADWQLVRPDGDTELYARYLLETSDGFKIQIINQAIIHVPSEKEKGGFYVKSVVDMEAPLESPYAYLNHAIFVGTLQIPQLKPSETPYVIISVYKVL